jgi:methylenetetrahydrofolate--tRNA-(uracil-5-)-methyltransferase
MNGHPHLFIAGQLSGVEGYVESAATGILAAINAERLLKGKPLTEAPLATILGSLIHYITHTSVESFAPMNANFGIVFGANKHHRELTIEASSEAVKYWMEALRE